MKEEVISFLCCPVCNKSNFGMRIYQRDSTKDIREGVIICKNCRRWYPIEEYTLELLPDHLSYTSDRKRFYDKHTKELRGLTNEHSKKNRQSAQAIQQGYFDWYADNEKQSYSNYANSTFWKVTDGLIFSQWKTRIKPGSRLVDVGSAQGRSAFLVADLAIDIVAFDISKNMIAQAVARYKKGRYKARMSFLVADASHLPFKDNIFDTVLCYGVLHHLPDPAVTSSQIGRILKKGGRYFGLENHTSLVRVVFDVLQRLFPIWYEKAGSTPVMNAEDLKKWFWPQVSISTYVRTFIPPHIVNVLPNKFATWIITKSDHMANTLGLASLGGLLVIEGTKK